jgi:hypothetical protein
MVVCCLRAKCKTSSLVTENTYTWNPCQKLNSQLARNNKQALALKKVAVKDVLAPTPDSEHHNDLFSFFFSKDQSLFCISLNTAASSRRNQTIATQK